MEMDTLGEALKVSSLPVANVQALAAATGGDSDKIPERYIRPEVEDDVVIGDRSYELPVIDLGKLLHPQFSTEETAKLGSACGEWGFFQLINHGVDDELINKMKGDLAGFFDQPLERKTEVAQMPNDVQGYGQNFVVSENQKLDWADVLFLATRPAQDRTMKLWPTHPPTFRDTLDRYSTELKKVAAHLLEFMAKDLGLETEVMMNVFEEQPQSVRMNYYPPCPKSDKVLGLSPHTDGTGLTLLLNVNGVHGLQIRKKDGTWFTVEALPDAFVVNIGDILEIFTNGRYRSVEHRAVISTTKERISVATFHGPYSFCTVGPLPELLLLRGGEKPRYKSIHHVDYLKSYLSEKLQGRRLLESLKLRNN